MNIKQQFFNELSEVLEQEFEKFEKCSCGKRLPCRSKALVLNAYANIFFDKSIKEIIVLLQFIEKWPEPSPKAGEGGPGHLFTAGLLAQYKADKEKHEQQVGDIIKNYEQN